MNRIETKIIIMVTNKLAAAKDSEAKMELIEELSENLYQRYQDLTMQGIGEEEALVLIMDSLGDVKELLAYLKEEGASQCENPVSGQNADDQIKKFEHYGHYGENWEKEHAQEIYEMEKQMEAKIVAEMKPEIEKMEAQIEAEMKQMPVCAAGLDKIDMNEIHTIRMELRKGDIEVNVQESLQMIDICTEQDDLEILEPETGILLIRQKKAKDGSLFSRLMEKNILVELGLPAKSWERIELRSPNGDITVHPDLQYLQCKELEIVTASGDMEVWKVQADNVRLQTASGDVTAQVQCRNLHANSVSGDVEICESYCAEAEIQSVSGDVTAKLWSEESIKAGTTSGDVELQLGILSKTVKVSSVSGDCSLQVPREQGFSLQYKTTSGDFSAGNMNFSGIMKGKSGNLTYLDGGNSSVTMSSISGDMEIYA